MDELCQKLEPRFVAEFVNAAERGLVAEAAVDRFEHDAVIIARLDPALAQQADREIDGCGPIVKKKERRYIDSAAGKVNPGRGGRFDDHKLCPLLMASRLAGVNG